MLAVWASVAKSHAHQDANVCQQKYNRTADQICESMDLRNNISALEKLCLCRVIDGHLHFVLQEQRDNASIARLSQYSFPGLREITHHLLVYRVFNLTSLRRLFPNLAVIRGDVLFHNYALVIYDVPNLREVGLVSLTVILRGSVRIERNPRLCFVHTVDWEHITANRLAENYINRNRPQHECPECPPALGCFRSRRCGAPRCWGQHHCQTLCGSECPGGCVGSQCCHEECLGGCQRPQSATSCHACRNLLDEGRCTQSCSSPKFKVLQHRCEERSFCRRNYVIKLDTKECVKRCPLGYNVSSNSAGESLCVPCEGSVCPKECGAAVVKSVSRAQALRGCTVIRGDLTVNINGGENIERELEENLSSIEEVTGFVKVFRSNVTSLDFLRNLTRIGGNSLLHSNYSLVILDNPHLRALWNWTGRERRLTVERGKMFVHSNPRLCFHHIEALVNATNMTGLSDTDVSSTYNGDKVPCKVTPLEARVTPHLYGTLLVEVATSARLPPEAVYYVNYKKAEKNISLYEGDRPCSDQGWSTMEVGPGNGTSLAQRKDLIIVNLEPFTRYAVYVKAYSLASSGKGAQSDVLYAVTRPYHPTEPVGLEWVSRNSSTVALEWHPPRRPNGRVAHYLVSLQLLPDTPRIPPNLRFCRPETREYIDGKMLALAEAEKVSLARRKTPATKEDVRDEGAKGGSEGGEESCQAPPTPSCCACRDAGVGGSEDQEVMGQIAFEDFIMDNVYVKKVNRSRRTRAADDDDAAFGSALWLYQQEQRGERDAPPRAPRSAEPADDPLFAWEKAASAPSGPSSRSGRPPSPGLHPGPAGGEFPLHEGHSVKEFPSHLGIRPMYQVHEENLTKYTVMEGSVVLRQKLLTQTPRATLHLLRHYSLYSVSVVACHAPVTRKRSVGGRLVDVPLKLCSTIPASLAVHTRSSDTADEVPEGSLRAAAQNTSRGAVTFSWAPPEDPNGGVVAYIIKLRGSLSTERCVSGQQFEAQGRKYDLRDLSPGNYSVWVKVRSKARYGNFSPPVSFVIADDPLSPDFSLALTSSLLGVAGAVLAAVACSFWRRCRGRRAIPDSVDKVDFNPYYREGFAPAEMFREEFLFWRDDLRVRLDRPLGHGFFGMVFLGELARGGAETRVAVKTHGEAASADEILQFLKEAALMQNISCHHVVRLLGVVGDYAPVYVVMELMEEGDLRSFLKRRSIPHFQLVEMAVQAADGMAYLAAQKLVHRDLAARNCMLDHSLTLKIGDFGLTRNLKSDYYRKEGQGILPVKWMAPESLQFSVYSTQSDVWSYGVLLWEMATRGLTPYKNRTNDEVIRLVVEKYATLGRPRDCPAPLQRVMRRCWRYEARERPSFLAITKFLLKHTSPEFQQRFEQVSFYHGRASDYSRYQRSETCGFMSARESDDEDSDDLTLHASSDLDDNGAAEKDPCHHRSPGGSPSARESERKGRRGDGGEARARRGTAGAAEGRGAFGSHKYMNFSSDDLRLTTSRLLGRRTQTPSGLADMALPQRARLPTLVIPQEDEELRYAQLQLRTPSTPGSGTLTPASNSKSPASTPQTPGLLSPTPQIPCTPASPALSLAPHLSLSPGPSPYSEPSPSHVILKPRDSKAVLATQRTYSNLPAFGSSLEPSRRAFPSFRATARDGLAARANRRPESASVGALPATDADARPALTSSTISAPATPVVTQHSGAASLHAAASAAPCLAGRRDPYRRENVPTLRNSRSFQHFVDERHEAVLEERSLPHGQRDKETPGSSGTAARGGGECLLEEDDDSDNSLRSLHEVFVTVTLPRARRKARDFYDYRASEGHSLEDIELL
uniref:receptor protein-tyrosine kinase n=1 Tax=Penaeus chinensis TaxID=139456 RepID=A0A2R4H1H6_PENCE|nr:insulin-like androgenic hormone receptor [Penaeus chinensis]